MHEELVGELMSARRAVRDATKSDEPDAEAAARRRVHDAKVALGERGEPWWDVPSDEQLDHRTACLLRSLVRARGPSGSVDPVSAARVASGPLVRSDVVDEVAERVVRALCRSGAIRRVDGVPTPWSETTRSLSVTAGRSIVDDVTFRPTRQRRQNLDRESGVATMSEK